MKRSDLLFTALLVLFGCSDGAPDTAQDEATSEQETSKAQAMDLEAYDLPMLLTPPSNLMGDSVQVAWNEEFGHVTIAAGDHFGMTVSEEPGDIARLKGDLERDLLRKNTVVEEGPEVLIYRSSYPDDPELVFVHFYRIVDTGERMFVVESDPMGRFNEADVRTMAEAITTKRPA